ncbi:MAG: TIGR03067 domain-containing protein [bacterium]
MNRPTPMLVAGLLSLSAVSIRAQAPNVAATQEIERLRGTFAMVSGQADGADLPATMTRAMKRVAEGNVTTVTMAGQLYMKATFTVDPAASPKTIDYDMTGGFTAGKKQLGLYRMSGDTVTFCFGSPGGERPRDLQSRAGSGVTCSVWRRESP